MSATVPQEMFVDDTKLRQKLMQLREDVQYQDVTVVANGNKFQAHKCILAVNSAFFHVLLSKSQNNKGKQKEDVQFIHLAKLNSEEVVVLNEVFNFMYTGRISITERNFVRVLRLANYLVINELQTLCGDYFRNTLNIDTCLVFYLSLKKSSLETSALVPETGQECDMKKLAWETLEVNFYSHVIGTKQILEVSVEDMMHILSEGIFKHFSVGRVFSFLRRWMEVRPSDIEVLTTYINIIHEKLSFLQDQKQFVADKGLVEDIHTVKSFLSEKCGLHDEASNAILDVLSNLEEIEQFLVSNGDDQGGDDVYEEMNANEEIAAFDDIKAADAKKSLEEGLDKRTEVSIKVNTDVGAKDMVDGPVADVTKEEEKAFTPEVKIDYHSGSDTDDVDVDEIVGANFARDSRNSHNVSSLVHNTGGQPHSDKSFLRRVEECLKLQNMAPKVRTPRKKKTPQRRAVKRKVDISFEEVAEINSKKIKVEVVQEDALEENNHDNFDNVDDVADHKEDFPIDVQEHKSELDVVKPVKKSRKVKESKPSKFTTLKSRKSRQRKLVIHKCTLCDKKFTRRYRLTEHMRSHEGVKCRRCIVCSKMFSRNDHVLRHMQKRHGDMETFQCDICPETFSSSNDIISHLTKHMQNDELTEDILLKNFNKEEREATFAKVDDETGKRVFGCKTCEKTFTRAYRLKDHVHSHLGSRPFECSECHENFTTKTVLNRHMNIVHGKATSVFSCPKCKRKYLSKTAYNAHVDTCEKNHKCDQCTAEFYTKYHLRVHIENVHSDSTHSCCLCNKTFASSSRLKEHVATIHEGKERTVKEVICDVCGLSFKGAFKLKRHMSVHTGIKEHQCAECGKQYLDLASLKNHKLKVHDKVKPYVCEICAMEFTVKSNLLRHQRRHRGEYHFFCDDCGKGFVANCDLTRHKLTHRPDKETKKHACQFCGKLFTRASKVQVHERIHTGERPYNCTVCNKKFTQSGDRNRHETKSHGIHHAPKLTLFEMANDTSDQTPTKQKPTNDEIESASTKVSKSEPQMMEEDYANYQVSQQLIPTETVRLPFIQNVPNITLMMPFMVRDLAPAAMDLTGAMHDKPQNVVGSSNMDPKVFDFHNGSFT